VQHKNVRPIGLPLSGQRVLGKLWRRLARVAKRTTRSRAVVLTYHEVGCTPHGLPPDRFAAQMQYLADCAKVVSLEELLRVRSHDGQSPLLCTLTFDDGYAGVYEHALPILNRYRFPAAVYLTTDAIGEGENNPSDCYPGLDPGERMLTWAQTRTLAQSGFTIGSHLCQHLDLSAVESEEGLRQLTRSKQTIESRVGTPCGDFAYPWGRFSLRSLEWVRAAGYASGVTVVHRDVPKQFDPYRVPRLFINQNYKLEDFRAVVMGDWDYLALFQLLRRPLTRVRIFRFQNSTGNQAE
jgi:peptidoglycan/xylan/chitin deacetylase (PgdA/CDA1 family)